MAEGSLEVDGVRLSYDIAGEGQPTLLIGGTGMSGSVWEFLGASVLRDAGFQVIAFDNRGVGRSDGPPGPYSVEAMAEETAALITALGVGPVNVIGLSLGGAIAQQLAATRPDLVHAVVLWAAAGRSPLFFRRLLELERELAASTPLPESWHLWQYLLISLPFEVLQNDDAAVKDVSELLQAGVEWSGDGRAGQFAADVEWDSTDHAALYPCIRCPCLVIAHEHDLIYPPSSARQAVASIPEARLIEIPGLAHGQAIDAAPTVMDEAVAFFNEPTSSASSRPRPNRR